MKYKNQYIIKVTYAGDTIEVQKTQSSRYGHAIPRNENSGKTLEAVQKINQMNAERTLRQLVNHNFCNDDYHAVLTYAKHMRPPGIKEARQELQFILRRLREEAKKSGVEVKYIGVTEIGEKGAVHHHLIINCIDTKLITGAFKRWVDEGGKKVWVRLGTVRLYPLYSDGQYKNLSNYIIKHTSDTLRKAGQNGKRWCASKNLKKPDEHKPRVVDAKAWRKEPKPPKGYRFDPAYPLVNGVCEVTGLAYQRYGFIKIMTYNERYPHRQV